VEDRQDFLPSQTFTVFRKPWKGRDQVRVNLPTSGLTSNDAQHAFASSWP